jgi:uncharacterized protein YoxC
MKHRSLALGAAGLAAGVALGLTGLANAADPTPSPAPGQGNGAQPDQKQRFDRHGPGKSFGFREGRLGGYGGLVTAIDSDSLTLSTPRGSETVTLNGSTEYYIGKTKAARSAISKGDVVHVRIADPRATKKVASVVTDAEQVAGRVTAVVGDAEKVAGRVTKVVGDAEAVAARVSTVVTDAEAVAARVAATVARAEEIAAEVEGLVTRAGGITDKANDATDKAASTVTTIQPLVDQLTPLLQAGGALDPEKLIGLVETLPAVLEKLAAQVDNLDRTVADVGALLQGIPGAARLAKRGATLAPR